MSATSLTYRWTQQSFLRATEAGVFEGRVELVDGEVWPVSIGRWHGRTTARCVVALTAEGVDVTTESLATGNSLPDPDVWVCPEAATETGWLSPRTSTWSPSDVLLVVEVSDETVAEDLSVKARLYGAAGYAVYWVVTPTPCTSTPGPRATGTSPWCATSAAIGWPCRTRARRWTWRTCWGSERSPLRRDR